MNRCSSLEVIDGNPQTTAFGHILREHRAIGGDFQLHLGAQELQSSILLQGAGQQTGFGEHLESVANSDDRAPGAGEVLDGRHHWRKPGNCARTEVIAMGKTTREDERAHVAHRLVAVPDHLGLGSQAAERLEHVELAVGAREQDDADGAS